MNKNFTKILATDSLRAKINQALQSYQDKYLAKDLISANCVKELIIESRSVILNISYGYLLNNYLEVLHNDLINLINPIIVRAGSEVGITLSLTINITQEIRTHGCKKGIDRLNNVKNIIAVASGKGGVGKSTVAVNLAICLQQQGAKVGILDADLYGPSIPHMLGCDTKVKIVNNKFEPHYAAGIYGISMGNLLEEGAPLVWRGPMVSSGLLQLLHNTLWPELDYLIVDLPPGTGDIQLTLAQKIPLTAAVIVTTPQPIALLDAQKSLLMLQKLQIPILGIVENMSGFICSNCQQEYSIFGNSGGVELASKYNLRLLSTIPLDLNIREQADLGIPMALGLPQNNSSKVYQQLASCVAAQLSLLPINLPSLSLIVD